MDNDKKIPFNKTTGTLIDSTKKKLIKTELGIDIDSRILSSMSDYVFKRYSRQMRIIQRKH